VLVALLAAEFLLVAALAVTLLVEVLVAEASSLPSAIALTVLAFAAAAWLGALVVGAVRGHAWIRGSAIVWQVLQFAVGAATVSGSFAQPAWGWPLILTAVAAFVLLLSRPVADAVATRPDGDA